MKCPLMIAHVPLAMSEDNPAVGDCLKEECAWWDKDKDMCFRASETIELRFMRSFLRELRDKLPYAGQFVK